MSESERDDGFAVTCPHCGVKFSQRKPWYAHMRHFHPGENINFKRKCMIFCCLCDEQTFSMASYMDHIRSKHTDVQLSFEKKIFYCEEDLKKWKSEMEKETKSHYAVRQSERKLADGRRTMQYQCDRSGVYKPTGTCKRKFSGSKKMGKTCPAYFTILKTIVDDLMEIEVNFQTVHVGHKFDVHSIRRRSAKRERRLLAKGTRVRSAKNSKKLRQTKLEKDIHNIHIDGLSESYIKNISDIFGHEPGVEVQQMSCTCKQYAELLICEHVQTICRSLKIDLPNNASSSDDSNDVRDSLCFDADETDKVEEELANLRKNLEERDFLNSLEKQKASIINEFQQLVEKCDNLEEIIILKDIIEEGKFRLSSALELRPQENSHSSSRNTQQELSTPRTRMHAYSSAHRNAPATSVPHHQNNWEHVHSLTRNIIPNASSPQHKNNRFRVYPSTHFSRPGMIFLNRQNNSFTNFTC